MSPLLISFPSTSCTHLCTHSACWIVFLVPVYCPYLGEFTYNPILPSMSSSYLFWKLPPIISGAFRPDLTQLLHETLKTWPDNSHTPTRRHSKNLQPGAKSSLFNQEQVRAIGTLQITAEFRRSSGGWSYCEGVWLGWTLPILHTDAAQTDSEVISIWPNAETRKRNIRRRRRRRQENRIQKPPGGVGDEWMPAVG